MKCDLLCSLSPPQVTSRPSRDEVWFVVFIVISPGYFMTQQGWNVTCSVHCHLPRLLHDSAGMKCDLFCSLSSPQVTSRPSRDEMWVVLFIVISPGYFMTQQGWNVTCCVHCHLPRLLHDSAGMKCDLFCSLSSPQVTSWLSRDEVWLVLFIVISPGHFMTQQGWSVTCSVHCHLPRLLHDSAGTEDQQSCADHILWDLPSARRCPAQRHRGAGHLWWGMACHSVMRCGSPPCDAGYDLHVMRYGSPQCDVRYMCDEAWLTTVWCKVPVWWGDSPHWVWSTYIYMLYDSSLCHMKYMHSKA